LWIRDVYPGTEFFHLALEAANAVINQIEQGQQYCGSGMFIPELNFSILHWRRPTQSSTK
jgi:hypothetical protein